MPKIVYLYTSGGAPKGDIDNTPPWYKNRPTTNRFATIAPSDGMVNMFRRLAIDGHVDSFITLIDSTISPGFIHLEGRSFIYTIPSMAYAKHFICPRDILIVRGGFKSWIPFLDYIHKKRENWILFYRANTNRHAWPFWDITLNDLINEPKAIRGRLHYNFSKPVNETIFGIINAPGCIPREYDVMVGASHIHKKKSQYITVQALQKYYHMYGTKPHAIMPGGYMRGWPIKIIQDIMRSGDVDLEGPVNLTRQQLALMMNRVKLFVHPGYGGQNDRGILEAMCCGCLPLLFGHTHVSPVIWSNSFHISQDPVDIAAIIHQALEHIPHHDKSTYSKINGLHEVALPKILDLLSFINSHPTPYRAAACARFVGE